MNTFSLGRQAEVYCKNCKERAEKWAHNQKKWAEVVGQQELEDALSAHTPIRDSIHSDQRAYFRAFSPSKVKKALEAGLVIERWFNKEHGCWNLRVYTNIKVADKKYRPVHIVIALTEKALKIVTLYEPGAEG